jgi:RNA polymerase sigma-70 factor (sigma-E family)
MVSGGETEFEAFYRSNRPDAVRLAHLLVGSRTVGEDLAQDAFVILHRKWSEVMAPKPYLRTTIVNLARGHARRQIRERRHRSEIVETRPPALPPDVDETWEAIKRLKVKDRTVIVLRFYEDLTVPEIAKLLAVPEGTVKARLHRSLKKLEGLLS